MRASYQTEDALGRLLAHMERPDRLPVLLMLETGVRVGDAVKARGSDFTANEAGRLVFTWTAEKTGKSGSCELSDVLSRRLEKLARARKGKYIFPGEKPGTHITRQAIWARVKAAGKRAGISLDGLSPHSFRKVFAVRTRREAGFAAAKTALQHQWDATTAAYAYSDAAACPDDPITWGEVEYLAEIIADYISRKSSI